MKRSRLSYDEWKCILSKEQKIELFNNNIIEGYISLIDIEEVSEPQIWKFNGKDIIVCQGGCKWLSILPSKENYCITAMMNEKKEVLVWYIDMIATKGVDKDGIPYFDDLYLDLIVYPDGTVIEDDREELDASLNQGKITIELFELANGTCQKLKTGILANIDYLKEYTNECMRVLNDSNTGLNLQIK
ncbi:DUF402 domain-containing protein [Kineothrix sp. MB12-C1]|uniref:DUF402 domain-containing protein n=1 Tax=Kineothrix sp. MB12-C1 TaxID=3070215 RepID=UPI0027D29935|nr:DUF402 domain-containing protein [Kineothrix sp. MB12-C1]WMC92565.1 DUF402 domain-containing protein [Kineothrix sp. MB12-C1]